MARELLFSGDNRKQELRQLKRAFDRIAGTAAALRPGEHPAEPMHAVALIHAERGRGKTRLAMELYRYLAGSCDPDGYWPDDPDMLAEPVAVMPGAERNNFAAEMPFLWWGMAVADSPNPGNTIFGTLDDLLPHLTAARLAGRRQASARTLAAEAVDLATDVGLEMTEMAVEVTGEALGLGMIKRLGQGMWNIGQIVRRHTSSGAEESLSADSQVKSVVDAVMTDLSRLFAPRSTTWCGKPLVILVDDAQFADRDPAMAAFLERLIARSDQERWPLMLLITHWDKELRNVLAADGTQQPRSHVANVLRHATDPREVDPGRYAGQRGGSLHADHYLDVDLGAPVDDLRPALNDRYPGIEAGTATEILTRADGNPRMLEQIMARMERKPVWFEGGQTDNDLTPEGRSAILALSDLPLEEIVLQRLRDTPEDVRSALVLASLLGNRFVVDLVERLSLDRLQHPARSSLEEGESRYRFLRNVSDRSRNDTADFAERLFHEAATEYRRSGLARKEIASLPSDSDLAGALDSLLTGLVQSPDVFAYLTEDDLSIALSIAADRMERHDPASAALALARLVGVEDQRGNPEGAYVATDRFISIAEPDGDRLTNIPSYLLDQVVTALLRRGDRQNAERLVLLMLDRAGAQVERDPENTEWQRDLSISHDRVGDIRVATGDREGARKAFEAGMRIHEALARRDPENTEWQRDLIVSHVKLAGSGADPARHYAAALDIARTLASDDRLMPVDDWMIPELERRLAEQEGDD
ncbi:MAG: hypothetical protein P1U37_09230 [Minwuia sp.]|nr:hypothetical protein [Minwuia sp.]